MAHVAEWWLNRKLDGEWSLPISHVQGFRPVGGYLVGTRTTLEFVPNRFEALVGGSGWTAELDRIEHVSLGRRRLRIVTGEDVGVRQTLYTNRPKTVRRHLSRFLPAA